MEDFLTRAQFEEAAAAVRARTTQQPRIGLVLGSGLGGLAEEVGVHGSRVTAVQVRTSCDIIWAIRPKRAKVIPKSVSAFRTDARYGA